MGVALIAKCRSATVHNLLKLDENFKTIYRICQKFKDMPDDKPITTKREETMFKIENKERMRK